MSEELLPMHGFVLAGGKSLRMGTDKALLEFRGRPMVQTAVEKLRGFCTDVSIVGNRDDLSVFAPVVREERLDVGPAAGFEAGLRAAKQPWAMFVPVDVPLVPGDLLRRWATHTVFEAIEFMLAAGPLLGSSLYTQFGREPAFAILRPETLPLLVEGLDEGERRLDVLVGRIRSVAGGACYHRMDAAWFGATQDKQTLRSWFRNMNTPEDLLEVAP